MTSRFRARFQLLIRGLRAQLYAQFPVFVPKSRQPGKPRPQTQQKLSFSGITPIRIIMASLLVILIGFLASGRLWSDGTEGLPSILPDAERSALGGFASEVRILENGAMQVTELFPLSVIRGTRFHGIVRVLPLTYLDVFEKPGLLKYDDIRAFRDGAEEPLIIEDRDRRLIKIGDPQVEHPPGKYRYGLQYRVNGAIISKGGREYLSFFVVSNWDYLLPSLKLTLRLPKMLPGSAVQIQMTDINLEARNAEAAFVSLSQTEMKQESLKLEEDPNFSTMITFTSTRSLEARHMLHLNASWPAVGLVKPTT